MDLLISKNLLSKVMLNAFNLKPIIKHTELVENDKSHLQLPDNIYIYTVRYQYAIMLIFLLHRKLRYLVVARAKKHCIIFWR